MVYNEGSKSSGYYSKFMLMIDVLMKQVNTQQSNSKYTAPLTDQTKHISTYPVNLMEALWPHF